MIAIRIMKVGIFTQPLKNNYGGLLQNYALQQILSRMGYSPITLDYRPENFYKRYILSQCKTLLMFFLPSKRRPFQKYMKPKPRFPQMTDFVKHNIATTRKLSRIGKDTIKNYGFQAVICGSDQVWRPIYNDLNYSFLSFVRLKKIKKIAYGASFGVDYWEYTNHQTQMCSKLAKSFNAISVRERSGIDLCKNYLKVDAIEVLDPTLLLDKNQYMALCDGIIKSNKKFLAAYVLDMTDSKRQFIEKMANDKNLELNLFSAGDNLTMTVEQWLSNFRDADYVITDSFHGTVFSIIFKKQFISIVNRERGGDRFVSLLSKFNLMSRIVDVDEDTFFEDSTIDWIYVDAALDIWREKSVRFLSDSLR